MEWSHFLEHMVFFRPENLVLSLVLPNDCKADPEKRREAMINGFGWSRGRRSGAIERTPRENPD